MPSNAATNKKRLLLPDTMARAGWNFLDGAPDRDNVVNKEVLAGPFQAGASLSAIA